MPRFYADVERSCHAGKPWHRRDRYGFILDWMGSTIRIPKIATERATVAVVPC